MCIAMNQQEQVERGLHILTMVRLQKVLKIKLRSLNLLQKSQVRFQSREGTCYNLCLMGNCQRGAEMGRGEFLSRMAWPGHLPVPWLPHRGRHMRGLPFGPSNLLQRIEPSLLSPGPPEQSLPLGS